MGGDVPPCHVVWRCTCRAGGGKVPPVGIRANLASHRRHGRRQARPQLATHGRGHHHPAWYGDGNGRAGLAFIRQLRGRTQQRGCDTGGHVAVLTVEAQRDRLGGAHDEGLAGFCNGSARLLLVRLLVLESLLLLELRCFAGGRVSGCPLNIAAPEMK